MWVMFHNFRSLYLLFLLTVSLFWFTGCAMAIEQLSRNNHVSGQSLGRFTISVPNAIRVDSSKFVINFTSLQEIAWKNPGQHESELEKLWQGKLDEIKSVTPPKDKKEALIEVKDVNRNGIVMKTILSYPDRRFKDRVKYDVFRDLGVIGIWASMVGTENRLNNIKETVLNVAEQYKLNSATETNTTNSKYLLNYGYVYLPFKYAENSYVRLIADHFNSKITIETKVVEKVEKTNLIERLTAALASNYAPGVSVEKIRAAQRSVAGMKGDEVVMRGKEGDKSELSFSWRFNGEKNSATAPRMTIEMESPDEMLEQKLVLWDALLDSIRPVPQ